MGAGDDGKENGAARWEGRPNSSLVAKVPCADSHCRALVLVKSFLLDYVCDNCGGRCRVPTVYDVVDPYARKGAIKETE